MSLFPIFLKLAARPCVVVGAGTIAESKIESLLAAEARVTVIAPEALPRVQEWAESGQLVWLQREYVQGDLAGAFLVVAATATNDVNRTVYAEANAADILCNAVDDPPFCDYYFPSVVRRGELQIAISTAGESPALAQRLRKEIGAQLPLDTGEWLMELGRLASRGSCCCMSWRSVRFVGSMDVLRGCGRGSMQGIWVMWWGRSAGPKVWCSPLMPTIKPSS
jgi:precorrin-2 dehydrogenase/sirohydrochlorin ferrochelatase